MIRDPGEQDRGSKRRSANKAPEPMSLFDISDTPPNPAMQVKSGTSIDAAKEIREKAMTRRRHMVLLLLKSTSPGLARFQIAQRLAVPDHWITSTIDALVKMAKVEEHPTLTVVNPKSGKACSVLVALESAETESAA